MGPKGELVMNSTNDEPQTAAMAQQPGDKLELTFDDGGSSVLLRYNRTNLTVEPKAADEE